jgi:hypothetical protein
MTDDVVMQAGMANGCQAREIHKRLGTSNPVLMLLCDLQLHILRTGEAEPQALAAELVAEVSGVRSAGDGGHKAVTES